MMSENKDGVVQKWLSLFSAKKLPDQIAPVRRSVGIKNIVYEEISEIQNTEVSVDNFDFEQDNDLVDSVVQKT